MLIIIYRYAKDVYMKNTDAKLWKVIHDFTK